MKNQFKGFAPPQRINKSVASAVGAGNEPHLQNLSQHSLSKATKSAPAELDPTPAAEPTPQVKQAEPEPPKADADQVVSLNAESLKMAIAAATKNAVSEIEAKLASQFAAKEAELQQQIEAEQKRAAEAEEAAQKAIKEAKNIVSVFDVLGYQNPATKEEQEQKSKMSAPNFNKYVSVSSDTPTGSVKEALEILDASPSVIKHNKKGERFVYPDQTALNRFVRENRKSLMHDMEGWAKGNGLLRGKNQVSSYANLNAATVASNIPGGFLNVLSSMMRTINRPRFVFWQFADTVHQFDKGQGQQAEIPRATFLVGATTSDERLLSGSGVYRPIDPGAQNLSTGVELVTLNEYGLGASPAAAPITIPMFVESYSMIDLMNILQRNLLQDYWIWEDVIIREQYRKTTSILYSNAGEVTTTVTAGSAISETFLNNLFAYNQTLQIPTYSNGCYVLVLPTQISARFKNSFGGSSPKWEAPSEAALQELTNILNPAMDGEFDRVQGYLGTYCNMMLFDQNVFGVGSSTVNGVNGVQTISSNVYRSALCFGANAVGRGVGTEFTVRQSADRFERANSYIWTSEEAFVPLDVCPVAGDTRPVPQQLRVHEVRFAA